MLLGNDGHGLCVKFHFLQLDLVRKKNTKIQQKSILTEFKSIKHNLTEIDKILIKFWKTWQNITDFYGFDSLSNEFEQIFLQKYDIIFSRTKKGLGRSVGGGSASALLELVIKYLRNLLVQQKAEQTSKN